MNTQDIIILLEIYEILIEAEPRTALLRIVQDWLAAEIKKEGT